MRRLLPLALLATAVAFPATADARDCETPSVYSMIETHKVGCPQAKKIFKAYFKDSTELFGYSCKVKQYPGGATTTCTKGDRRAIYYSAD